MPQAVNHSSQSAAFAVSEDGGRKKKQKEKQMASVRETLGFVFGCGPEVTILFVFGTLAGFLNGLAYPALAFVLSRSFSDLAGAAMNGLGAINNIAFSFMAIGAFALGAGLAQNWAFELVGYYSSQYFRLEYFRALLRQDQAFYDVHDISGISSQLETNANRFRRGVGRKFGQGVEYTATGIGGLSYALYSSWRVALIVLAVGTPLASLTALTLMRLNQSKATRSAQAYKRAGGVAYSAVSSIKTVLSLNAVKRMLEQYKEATLLAFRDAVSFFMKIGAATGAMLGSFLVLYCILTLYGTSLLYAQVQVDGCDPSASAKNNEACSSTGAAVFGAMLGISFASQGLSQVGNMIEAFAEARVAVFEALLAINRKPGSPEQIIYKEEDDEDNVGSTSHLRSSKRSRDVEAGTNKKVRAIIPKFLIDSASRSGLRPASRGQISFRNVSFFYPARPGDMVLQDLSFDIEAGETVALVGPSGSGKSSIVLLLERFYDPTSGRILLDGVDLKDINVSHLRGTFGYVGQEPALFATTIRENILYGNPFATKEKIEEAARLANAHDFISALSDGYDTEVGDAGSMLSGGQKQRICLARVLVMNPKILILDEATSALDAESELVVQEALDNILETKKITAIIIAHRLSTIRNADKINVIVSGQVKERGTHDELMAGGTFYRRLVQKEEGIGDEERNVSRSSSRGNFMESFQSEELTKYSLTVSTAIPQLEFNKVVFCYPARPQKKVLDGFSLAIKQGETVALVGPSGGGKSTIAVLMERFYDVSEGQVLYLGQDIRSLNVDWYRSQLSYVGQEPTLFNMTIAENIVFGADGISRADVEVAARQANAHDFILEFPEGYETRVGASKSNTGLSGGQKQRIAIARALVRKPRVLILDEATSSLDNDSAEIVQAAIDKLMQSPDHTVVVIAHRLSTIRNANRIALISDGTVVDCGSHEELMKKTTGRYKRLFESSKLHSTVDSVGLRRNNLAKVDEDKENEETGCEEEINKDEMKSFSVARARHMARPDMKYILVGALGAAIVGAVYPCWGVNLSKTINLLYTVVVECPDPLTNSAPAPFTSCEDYWSNTADSMRQTSFEISVYWACLLVASLLGNIIMFWGFGTASERLNKRIRDSSFLALLRQEVAFFDTRSVGSITSQLQDDAARIHAFSGEPIRTAIGALASVLIGVVIAMFFMWPLALVSLGCIPLIGFSVSMRMKQMTGNEKQRKTDNQDVLNSPAGIVVETLLNMRTVSALVIERRRFENYQESLLHAEPNHRLNAFTDGIAGGLAVFVQQWVNALQFWLGGWLLVNYPTEYSFNDFLLTQFSIMFALFGLGSAFANISDRSEVEMSARRIFHLLDRVSQIDSLSTEGKKFD